MSDTQTPIHELAVVTDAHMVSPLWVAVSNALIGTTPERALYEAIVNPTTVLLGSELIPSDGWTTTGWTGTLETGYTHTPGNISALENTIAAIINSSYQLSIVITGRTAGSISTAFGGKNTTGIIASNVETIVASTNGNLVINPTTDFDGTCVISIKQLTWQPPTEAEILAILGVPDVVQSSQLALYVLAVANKSLLSDTEIVRLLTIKSNPYLINLPAGNLATKIAGATFLPAAWATIAVDSSVNAMITHILTGRKARFINIYEVDGTNERLLSFDKGTAYTGVLNNGLTTLIEGIAPTTLPVVISLIFD